MTTSTGINAPFLNTSIVFSEDESQRLYELTKLVTDIANYLNIREIAQFELVELLNGQRFAGAATSDPKKFVFRKVFYFGAIAAGGPPLVIPHGITGITEGTHMYGTCVTSIPDFRPIPYSSATIITDQIELKVSPINITIVVGATSPNVTKGKVILEYLKN